MGFWAHFFNNPWNLRVYLVPWMWSKKVKVKQSCYRPGVA